MLVTIDTSSIPAESFSVIARKNATNRIARRCPVSDPSWLTSLLAGGCALQLEDVVLQSGRHFSDRVNRQIFSSNPSRRQAATAIAWTILSLVAPFVTNSQLFVSDPLHRAFEGRATREDIDAIRGWASATDDDLLSRAEREMQAGAKIVFWGETNAPVLKQDEGAFVIRGGKLATKYHAYLGMALGVLNAGNTPPLENKLVLVQPNGQVAWEYNKARPVPGPEAALQVRGDGKLRALDTPYGRVSSIVCFDGDFPQLLAQAGALGADVVLDPSNDWRAIDPWHTQMASFRAIEQGFNLVRQTSQGLSAAFDYQGRRLAAMDHYRTTDYVMVSQVPTRGVRTVYSRLGDWFAWMCLAGLALLTLQSLRRKRPDSAVLGTLTHC